MKDEASVNNMRENYFSISSMLRENYKIEWSCYLRWGREVLCEVSRTSYKTWCTNVWHCHQISMGRLYISTVSITRSQESSWSLWVSLVLDTRNHPCRERCLLSLTVTPTLRLTMGPGTGPAPSTRILTLDTGPADLAGPVWSESGDFWERSPGSARSSDLPRAARDHQETRTGSLLSGIFIWMMKSFHYFNYPWTILFFC